MPTLFCKDLLKIWVLYERYRIPELITLYKFVWSTSSSRYSFYLTQITNICCVAFLGTWNYFLWLFIPVIWLLTLINRKRTSYFIAIEYMGGMVPYYILKQVLVRCSAQQLHNIEDYNPVSYQIVLLTYFWIH